MDGFPRGIPNIEPIPWTDRAPPHALWTPSCLTKGPFTTNNTVVRGGCCLSCVQSSCSLWVLCWDTWRGRWPVSRLTVQILLFVPPKGYCLPETSPPTLNCARQWSIQTFAENQSTIWMRAFWKSLHVFLNCSPPCHLHIVTIWVLLWYFARFSIVCWTKQGIMQL